MEDARSERTLLLDAGYAPITVISWTRAISLLWLGKVEVVEEYDCEVRSPSVAIKLPAVVRLVKRMLRGKHKVRFSRQNIYLRDNGRCQYCKAYLSIDQCTFDHVVPRVKGGKTNWTNVVLCCMDCNHQKGAKTPEQAGMRLLKPPRVPHDIPYVVFKIRQVDQVPVQLKDYLASVEYWTASLLST